LIKTKCSRARQLKIAASLYSPARGSRIVYYVKKASGVGLEEQGVVAKCLKEVLPHYISFTMFGNLEVFFVSLSLLSHYFIILIKYSRA